MSSVSAEDVVRLLKLQPHPEGGYYRETFRDPTQVRNGRAASTAIYFLLVGGQETRWHRIDSVEVWHWYAGAAFDLEINNGVEIRDAIRLGGDLARGERPQAIVPAHFWQRSRSLGGWSLAGCTVAPGFDFSTFEIAASSFAPTSQRRV